MPSLFLLLARPQARRCLCGLLALLLLGGGIAAARKKKSQPEALGSELARAPAAAQAWENPYAARPEAIRAGKKLYERHCSGCHGLEGNGGEEAPDLHSPVVQAAPPGVLFWFLKNGNLREGMPSWSRLPDQQRWQLVTYLRTLPPQQDPAEE